jgi:S1-C subfamily serine protease
MEAPRRRLAHAALVLLVLTLAVVGCSAEEDGPPAPVRGVAESLESEFASVVQKALPSVVEISHGGGVGSGVVFDDRGHIVTNAHVVGNGTKLQVRLAASSVVRPATLVASYPVEDLAVIRVADASRLVPARFDETRDLRVGEIVLAMGSPLGLESSVTQGIVSALGRVVPEPPEPQIGFPGTVLRQVIQTSAPINPGNSGGALVDLEGEVVGVPTLAAVNPGMGAAQGVGFAIPGHIVRDLAGQIVEHGRVVHSGRATLGVTGVTVTNDRGEPVGVGVAALDPKGPAATAGVEVGDLVTRVDGDEVRTAQDLRALIAMREAGGVIRLTVLRAPAAEPHTFTIKLGELPAA